MSGIDLQQFCSRRMTNVSETAVASNGRPLAASYRSHFDPRQPCRRWTAGRKAQLLDAIERRHISLEDALSIHRISLEEVQAWGIVRRESITALRVTDIGKAERNTPVACLNAASLPDSLPEYGLTALEAHLFALLVAHVTLTKEAAYTALWPDFDTAPGVKILDVLIHHIRKKTAPLGVVIHTLWGRGWRLDPETRAMLTRITAGTPDTMGVR